MKTIAELEFKYFEEGRKASEEYHRKEYNKPRYFGVFSNKHLDWITMLMYITLGAAIGTTWGLLLIYLVKVI